MFAAIAITGVKTFKPRTGLSEVASGASWSGGPREDKTKLCLDQLRQSTAGPELSGVQSVFCDCQVAAAEKWLQPVDLTIIQAAINGESDAELEARALALPKAEAIASEKRMRNYTRVLTETCVKASLDAALNMTGGQ